MVLWSQALLSNTNNFQTVYLTPAGTITLGKSGSGSDGSLVSYPNTRYVHM